MKRGHLCPSPAHHGLSMFGWHSRPAQEEPSASDLYPKCHHGHRFLYAIFCKATVHIAITSLLQALLELHTRSWAVVTHQCLLMLSLSDISRQKVW